MKQALARELLRFIRKSPSCYHVIANLEELLQQAGYQALREEEPWSIGPGGRYYVVRNGSSILAFRTPERLTGGYMLAAAHSDSPTFKLKEQPEKLSAGHYVQLSTEKYGGMLMGTWLDRPLSVAGRVLVRREGKLELRLVDIDRDLLVIPNVAIHMDRTANDGKKYLANVDTLPLLGGVSAQGGFYKLLAESAGVRAEDILGHDLFLYCRESGTLLGPEEEYILSPKLDDLECAYGCMQGFLQAEPSESIPVCCVFDNEEVGSETKQGAASPFLRDTLRRLARGLGLDEEAHQAMLARSFLVSADNAHAQHPNHPEYSDSGNCQSALCHRRLFLLPLPGGLPSGRRAGAGLCQPVGSGRRQHPGQHRQYQGPGEHRRHRPAPAGHAFRRGDGGRGRSFQPGPGHDLLFRQNAGQGAGWRLLAEIIS